MRNIYLLTIMFILFISCNKSSKDLDYYGYNDIFEEEIINYKNNQKSENYIFLNYRKDIDRKEFLFVCNKNWKNQILNKINDSIFELQSSSLNFQL